MPRHAFCFLKAGVLEWVSHRIKQFGKYMQKNKYRSNCGIPVKQWKNDEFSPKRSAGALILLRLNDLTN